MQQPRQPTGMDQAWASLHEMGNAFIARLPYAGVGLLVALGFYLVGRVLRRVLHTTGMRTRIDVQLTDLFGSLAVFGMTIFGLLVAAVITFPNFRPGDLVAGLGLTSVVIGFAFKDILQNYFAGILILLRRPFQVNDQIRTMDLEGTVEGINVRSTYLKTYDGERVVIPNSDVWTHAILVRTAHPHRRVVFDVQVASEEPLDRARDAIMEIVKGTEGVLVDPGPWVYVQDLAPQWVVLRVYFWTEPRQDVVLRVREAALSRVKLELDARGIVMPYPKQVIELQRPAGEETPGDAASAAT